MNDMVSAYIISDGRGELGQRGVKNREREVDVTVWNAFS
jgi:hypothetical protein